MNPLLHIIITSEHGQSRTLTIRKDTLRRLSFSALLLLVLLGMGTGGSYHFWQQTQTLGKQTTALEARLLASEQLRNSMKEETEALLATKEKEIERLQREKTALRSSLEQRIDELTSDYQKEIAELRQEKETLLSQSISRLDERSKILKSMMDELGIKVEEDPGHSGGLYIAPGSELCERLIGTSEKYIELARTIPLGKPIATSISSRFGNRTDPLNGRKAFHAGIDFRGRTGDKVRATGDGTVKKSSYNRGLGNYVVIRHGNGFETLFAHLSKRLVKKGEKIVRGQVIGLVGNTGRSTGSHLHYEVHRNGKAINPVKLLRIASLISRDKQQ